MEDFEDLFVSHHQLVVSGGWDGLGLGIYVVGGRLLQLTGPTEATVFTGPHTGTVLVRATGLPSPAGDAGSDWDAVEEVTLWVPEGQIRVFGLMGDPLPAAPDLAVSGPGLYRIQVRARGRRAEDVESDGAAPEQFEILAWPVAEDCGHSTLRLDELPAVEWAPQPARAAQLAMIGILTGSCNDPFDPNGPRRTPERHVPADSVRRVRVMRTVQVAVPSRAAVSALHDALGPVSSTGAQVVPVGPLDVTLTPDDSSAGAGPGDVRSLRWQWGWASATRPDPEDDDQAWAAHLTIPDAAATRVDLRAGPGPSGGGTTLTVVQHDVLACDAVQLGLIWEYYLGRAQAVAQGQAGEDAVRLPWTEMLARVAAREADERAAQRHQNLENQTSMYGGYLPSPRLRNLPANVVAMAQLDPRLLDALAEADPRRQRTVAVWAAREACTVSRLIEVDWISQGLIAVEEGRPLPEAFGDTSAVWDRLWADPATPATVVVGPGGTPNCSQQAMALPTLLATADTDPLAAAVNALYAAAISHGPAWPEMLERARREFPDLTGGGGHA